MAVAETLQQTRIHLSGPLTIETARQIVTQSRFSGRQERTVFSYLVLNRTRVVTREELADVLWTGRAPPRWEASLRAILSRLRGRLREAGLGDDALTGNAAGYRLNSSLGLWVDAEAAVTALEEAEVALRAGRAVDAFSPATVAAVILERPFASGLDGAWVDGERERLGRLRVRALQCLAGLAGAG